MNNSKKESVDYSKLTDEEVFELSAKINKEKREREKIQYEKEKQKKKEFAEFVMKHRDKFISAMRHGRTSCSDESPNNVGRCRKCDFMDLDPQAVEWGEYGIEFDTELQIHVTFYEE